MTCLDSNSQPFPEPYTLWVGKVLSTLTTSTDRHCSVWEFGPCSSRVGSKVLQSSTTECPTQGISQPGSQPFPSLPIDGKLLAIPVQDTSQLLSPNSDLELLSFGLCNCSHQLHFKRMFFNSSLAMIVIPTLLLPLLPRGAGLLLP